MNTFKYILITVFLAFTVSESLLAQAPSFKDFEWDFQLGYVYALNFDKVHSGVSLGSEIRYNLADSYSIGIDSDVALLADKVPGEDADIYSISSGLLTIDRYFGRPSPIRPFIGFGFGEYSSRLNLIRDGEDETTLNERSSFGVMFRGGYEYKHARFQLRYNLTTQKGFSDYLTLTAAIVIWGGYNGD